MLTVGFISCTASPATKNLSLDQVIQQAAEKIEERLDNGTKVALINVQSPTAQFSEYVLTYLESILVNNGKLIVVDRSNLDKIRQELGFQLSGEVSDESAKSIGKMLGAGAIVTGSLLTVGDSYRLTLKAINVETATVVASYPADIAKNERVKALLASGNTATTAGNPGIIIVNNTGTTIYRIGLFPTGSRDNLVTFNENIDNKISKRLSLPSTDPTKKYSIMVLNTNADTYIKENLSIKPDMTITFNQSDKSSQTATATTPSAPVASYKIGDTGPAGGIIFYDKGNSIGGWQYLEAAPQSTEAKVIWSHERRVIESVINQRALGLGKQNTQKIMDVFNNRGGGFDTAARICIDLTINGFNDWFLPSFDELNWMYGNLHRKGIGEFKNERYAYYWSSTQESSTSAFSIDFSNGHQMSNDLIYTQYVRAIRQF